MKTRRMIHVQPETAVREERDDEPHKQSQWDEDCDNHVPYFVAEVHEYLNDICRLEDRHQEEERSGNHVRHPKVVTPQAKTHFKHRDDRKQYRHLYDAAYLLLA